MSNSYSTILFACPSWLSGAARTMDIGATFDGYNESPSAEQADARALAADFMAVASDFAAATRAAGGR